MATEESSLEKNASAGETSWLQGKAQMLDEVNKLVELMSAEKSQLQERIASLESELDGYHRQTKQLQLSSVQKDENLLKLKLEQSIAEEKKSQKESVLQETLHRTKRELRNVQEDVESLSHSLAQEKQCHQGDMLKLENVEKSNADISQQLHYQLKQNKKLRGLLQRAEEQIKETDTQRKLQELHISRMKEREKKSREEILALRGRLSRNQRAQDQTEAHCSVLEKELESHVKQLSAIKSRRSKEETRLIQECRKKDELLATYVHKITTTQEEQQALQKELRLLKARLAAEENQKKELKLKIEESEKKIFKYKKQNEDSDRLSKQQEERWTMEQSLLLEKAVRLTDKLESSQSDASQLRAEVESVCEREKYYTNQLKKKEEEVTVLQRQLETTWTNHQKSMIQSERQWTARLKEAHSDYIRLKEVSTKRCVELAREISQLKSDLKLYKNEQL